MVLVLGSALDLPLRDRNDLLSAAGYAPVYASSGLLGAAAEPVRRAVEHLLSAHEPYGAVLCDQDFNVLRMNRGAARLFGWAAEGCDAPPEVWSNVMAATVHPGALRGRIENFDEVAAELAARTDARARPRARPRAPRAARRRAARARRAAAPHPAAGPPPRWRCTSAAERSRCGSSPPSPPWARPPTSPPRSCASRLFPRRRRHRALDPRGQRKRLMALQRARMSSGRQARAGPRRRPRGSPARGRARASCPRRRGSRPRCRR